MGARAPHFASLVALLLWASLLTLPLTGGSPAALAEGGPEVRINQIDSAAFPAVEATVVVLDPSGVPIRGLTVQDFQVSDGSRPVKVTGLSQAVDSGAHIAVVLAIDTSGSMAGEPLAQAKQVARDFVARLSEGDKAMLLAFGDTVSVAQALASDKNAVLRAIDGLQARGDTALYDTTVTAVGWAAAADLPRRAIVLLTDGQDYGGRSSASRSASLNAAAKAGVPIFTVGLGPNQDKEYLNQLSALTQGQSFSAATPAELAPLYESIQGLLRGQYILKIDFGQSAQPGSHTLRVQVSAGGSSGAGERTFEAIPLGYRPPQISLPNLTAGQTIDAPVQLFPFISASESIAAVRYLWDGREVAQSPLPPYEHTLDPIAFLPGAHVLRVEVTDATGATRALDVPVIVAVVPPRIRVAGPLGEMKPGSEAPPTIEESITLEALVNAQGSVQTVRFYVNGRLESEQSSPPYTFHLNPEAYQESALELVIVARDAAGQETQMPLRLQASPATDGGFSLTRLTVSLLALGVIAMAVAGLLVLFRGRRRHRAAPSLAPPSLPSAAGTDGGLEAAPSPAARASGPLARLTVTGQNDSANGRVLNLGRKPFTIGSAPGCDLVLPVDGVAPRQVRIWYRQGKFMLHAISPHVSATIAGKPVYWAVLESGDEIEIGSYRLRFEQIVQEEL